LAPQLIRVCLIGPECTGKSTLAEELAVRFAAAWVPEFAREYAERVARELTADDVEPIARGQMALEDAALKQGVGSGKWGVGDRGFRSRLLILDTDLISTVVYARHYYGRCPQWIEREAEKRKSDLYLLTSVDVPWVPDSLRDSAAPRERLYDEFARTLKTCNADVVELAGSWEQRSEAAIRQLSSLPGRPPATECNPHR
jgi:HTH-type transcriptional regulator, transcriptional repressor of NAD biosynthesis genes